MATELTEEKKKQLKLGSSYRWIRLHCIVHVCDIVSAVCI